MPISLDRSICCDFNQTISREWLITNGIGGYAAGTVAGVLTRIQHGLLAAVMPGDTAPQLLLAKVDEEVVFDQRTYYLGTNEYGDGTIKPSGFVHLESFHLEGGSLIFTYRLGGINDMILEKRIWMPPEQNTTCIQYRVISTNRHASTISGPLDDDSAETTQHALRLTLLPFTTYRPFDRLQPEHQHFQLHAHRFAENIQSIWHKAHSPPESLSGCTIQAGPEAHPYHLLALAHPDCHATFIPTGVWYGNFLRRHDQAVTDNLYLPGVVRASLWPAHNVMLTLVVSAEPLDTSQYQVEYLTQSYTRSSERLQHLFHATGRSQPATQNKQARHEQQGHVLPFTTTSDPQQGGEDYLRLLLQAGDHFLARYQLQSQPDPHPYYIGATSGASSWTLRSDYFGMAHKVRDTLIALPGLTLVTGRYIEAASLLNTIARHFRDGLLPDHLPPLGERAQTEDYNNVDNTLWFFYTLDHYVRATQHYALIAELYSTLKAALDAYIHGTRNGIQVDLHTGLLHARQPGKALTWMNAYAQGTPVTPRAGAAVEINALWFNALSLMLEWSQYGKNATAASYYRELAKLCKEHFQRRFWYDRGSYLYDVIDGPEGDDAALRPNQLLALSLRYTVLDASYWQHVYDAVTQNLLTPFGLRTLAPHDSAYRGHIGEEQFQAALALHQGSVWPWLIGPYIDAVLVMQNHSPRPLPDHDRDLFREYIWRRGLRLLEPFKERLYENLLGACVGILDGEQPHHAGPYPASALSTGELLRMYDTLAHIRFAETSNALTR